MRYRQCSYQGHRYYEDTVTGRKVPSVTTITSQLSPFKGRPGTAARVGSLIHYHILKCMLPGLESPGEVLWNVSDSDIQDKIAAGLRMWRELGISLEPVGIEDVIFSHDYGYAGRVDRHGYSSDGIYVVDEIKTGAFYEYYRLQGAAYAVAVGADRVRFIMLDVNKDRNPARAGHVITMEKPEIDEKFAEFLGLLDTFTANYK